MIPERYIVDTYGGIDPVKKLGVLGAALDMTVPVYRSVVSLERENHVDLDVALPSDLKIVRGNRELMEEFSRRLIGAIQPVIDAFAEMAKSVEKTAAVTVSIAECLATLARIEIDQKNEKLARLGPIDTGRARSGWEHLEFFDPNQGRRAEEYKKALQKRFAANLKTLQDNPVEPNPNLWGRPSLVPKENKTALRYAEESTFATAGEKGHDWKSLKPNVYGEECKWPPGTFEVEGEMEATWTADKDTLQKAMEIPDWKFRVDGYREPTPENIRECMPHASDQEIQAIQECVDEHGGWNSAEPSHILYVQERCAELRKGATPCPDCIRLVGGGTRICKSCADAFSAHRVKVAPTHVEERNGKLFVDGYNPTKEQILDVWIDADDVSVQAVVDRCRVFGSFDANDLGHQVWHVKRMSKIPADRTATTAWTCSRCMRKVKDPADLVWDPTGFICHTCRGKPASGGPVKSPVLSPAPIGHTPPAPSVTVPAAAKAFADKILAGSPEFVAGLSDVQYLERYGEIRQSPSAAKGECHCNIHAVMNGHHDEGCAYVAMKGKK